jgi:hypothetical protein
MTVEDQERAAYIAGDTDRAALLARIIELEQTVCELETQIDDTETLDAWENKHGSATAFRDFFYACFGRLGAHYPAPSISSDEDQSVIFDAIERGEE